MRCFSLLILSLPVLALVPRWNQGNDDDISVLNFELSLKHLENAFYEQGLRRFENAEFRHAGFPDYVRGRFEDIYKYESIHAAFLSEAISRAGSDTVHPCQYRFPLQNPRTFARASLDISTIAAAAYNGALGLLNDKDYLIADGSILSSESRHASWINSALFHKNPWNAAFDTPLSFRQAWTAISRYIDSCPRENSQLVLSQSTKAFPHLEVVSRLVPGLRGQVNFRGVEVFEENKFSVIFKTGMQEFSSELERDGFFIVPKEVANTGANFIFVSSTDGPVNDENIIAGPTVYQFDFSSHDNTYHI